MNLLKRTLSLVAGLCLLGMPLMAVDIQSLLVPQSLRKDANAVVMSSHLTFEYKSAKSAIERHRISITVLNSEGDRSAAFHYSADKFRTLKKFSGTMTERTGRSVKLKLSDVKSSEYSSALANDSRYYYLSSAPSSYPYTVTYDYEVQWQGGILAFPPFYPITDYGLSLLKASYTLIIPEQVDYRTKMLNYSAQPTVVTQKNGICCTWTMDSIMAFKDESFAPSSRDIFPGLLLSPKSFVFDNNAGTIDSWETMGAWSHALLEGRDALPPDCIAKVQNLTKDAASDRERVRILYDYLGATTRYVSIQLGIGGFQPMSAAEVYRTGFGDCKALSNYMKALLASVGIPSNYITIRSDEDRKSLMLDYPGFNEMNHAILQVPLAGDTLWLECTNTNVPFGFVHNSIAGHQALELSPQGGRICTLPDYPDQENLDKTVLLVMLNADGSAEITVDKKRTMKQYDDVGYVTLLKQSEQSDFLRKEIALPNVTMHNFNFEADKSAYPSLTADYRWTTTAYGSKTGTRYLFIPLNPMRRTRNWFTASERRNAIHVAYGYRDVDSVTVVLPEGYVAEALPQALELTSPFGSFTSTVTQYGNSITVVQTFCLFSGSYDAAHYAEIKEFVDRSNKAYSATLTVVKRE